MEWIEDVNLGHGAQQQKVVALAGGVGGAKLSHGLAAELAPGSLTVVVNTADDFEHLGLRMCADLDTVLYTLANRENPATGWGIAGDTRITLNALTEYGEDPWFLVGDQDFATHIYRTARLRAGDTLSRVTTSLARASGVSSSILPMSEDHVATIVKTADGELDFQDYFVARRQADDVLGVRFDGASTAHPATGVIDSIRDASLLVIAPSNPIVSIGPILTVPGIREAVASTHALKVAVSPIIGGKALKGPADRMMLTMGHDVSALGVARIYQGLVDWFVIDNADANLAADIRKLGMQVLVTDSIMTDPVQRARLASEIIALKWNPS